MAQVVENKKTTTLTDYLRLRFKGVLDPIGAFLNRLGITPNALTLTGLAGNMVGAYFLSQGQMTLGGIIIVVMGSIDALDGTMARLRGEPSNFGAFVDSVTDRYSELVTFLGLLIYYLNQDNWQNAIVVYLAAAGSVLVSYVRSRGETLGYEAKVGILTRFERYAVLAPSLIFNIPMVGLWIVAVFANFTALQRILHIRRQAHAQFNKKAE
ncbi:MAG: CDP-alcohol phosphatidyltransferase family protein [Anaerolineales bacterium]|nr:CDP-alcohol phosphatidyltransferase family protein [Anaerolineales bacterium]